MEAEPLIQALKHLSEDELTNLIGECAVNNIKARLKLVGHIHPSLWGAFYGNSDQIYCASCGHRFDPEMEDCNHGADCYVHKANTALMSPSASLDHEEADPSLKFKSKDLTGADLSEANLFRANLTGAYMNKANLHNANLYKADLRVVNLRGADLRVADLHGANLRGAYMSGADLRGAYMNGADLRGADLRCVKYGTSTKWPYGVSFTG